MDRRGISKSSFEEGGRSVERRQGATKEKRVRDGCEGSGE